MSIPNKKLIDLNPCFVGYGGEGVYRTNEQGEREAIPRREGIGLYFDCPCGCESPVYVDFENPLDGGPPIDSKNPKWKREGANFEELTLNPSVRRISHCQWHGWIKKGDVITC